MDTAGSAENPEYETTLESLHQQVSRYKASFHHSRDAINIFSRDYKILDVNESMCRLSGYDRQTLLSMHLDDLYPAIGSKESLQRIDLLQSKKEIPLFETTLLTRTGEKIPVEIAVNFINGWNGKGLVCQSNIRDISQAKAVLKKLKEKEEKYRGLIENLDAGISRSTPGPGGRYIEVNQALVDILGYDKKELFQTNIFAFHQDPSRAKRIYQTILSKGSVKEKEVLLIHKNGSSVVASYTAKAVRDTFGEIVYIDDIIVDITSRNAVEQEIEKNERLKSIGALAGGIAHHFNNIMTGLFGNISLAKMELGRNSQALPYLNDAEACMKEGISLTKQLLTFAKGGDPIKEDIDIAEIVEAVAVFILSGSSIRLDFSCEENLWQTRADKSQISQVISNIVLNARQAMPKGGTLDVRIENSGFLKDNLLTIAKDRYLKITITDSGTGIHQKDLDKIFDPYFTTRDEGSGMGLSICYSIIKKHDGHIFVTSQIGSGTTLTVYLPAHPIDKENRTTMNTEQPPKENTLVSPGKKHILVMDDEDHIRILLQRMLEKFGYTVDLTENGEAAIQQYRQRLDNTQRYDLVIMDLTIPGGMGGKDAAQKILEIDPQAKIAVSSGYSTDPIMANFEEFGLKGIIPKPYRMEELNKAIQQILTN